MAILQKSEKLQIHNSMIHPMILVKQEQAQPKIKDIMKIVTETDEMK